MSAIFFTDMWIIVMKMAYWHSLLPTAVQEYEDLQKKNKTAAMEVSVEN